MKRDDDLVRTILLALESLDRRPGRQLVIDGYDSAVVGHHVYLLMQGGYLDGMERSDSGNPSALPVAWPLWLTWAGHEFLNAARDDERWGKARGIASTAGGVSLHVLSAVLAKLAMNAVGLK